MHDLKESPPELEPGASGTLAAGHRLALPHRGTTFFREVDRAPHQAPVVVLLHGWCASAGLNWFRAFDHLGDDFRVIAPDLRGHARGLRSRERFTLARCADDTAEMLVELDTGPVIVVGYSMGGPIAQVLWRHHRDLVSGMVLMATSPGFLPVYRERVIFQTAMAAAAITTRAGGALARLPFLGAQMPLTLPDLPENAQTWAAAEFRRHDTRQLLEAGHAIGTYSAGRWINEIDVPTAVVVTTRDRAVAPHLQVNMAESIPGASVHVIASGHLSCAEAGFGRHVSDAVHSVTERVVRWNASA